jgi:hypothetical protein
VVGTEGTFSGSCTGTTNGDVSGTFSFQPGMNGTFTAEGDFTFISPR